MDQAATVSGRVDVLVDDAGLARLALAEEVTMEHWDAHIAFNLCALFLMSRQVSPVMHATTGFGADRQHPFSGGHHQHVEISCPGTGATRCRRQRDQPDHRGDRAWAACLSERPSEAMKLRIPTRRFAQPEEIALTALYLASGAGGMINGENLVVDGGFTIQ